MPCRAAGRADAGAHPAGLARAPGPEAASAAGVKPVDELSNSGFQRKNSLYSHLSFLLELLKMVIQYKGVRLSQKKDSSIYEFSKQNQFTFFQHLTSICKDLTEVSITAISYSAFFYPGGRRRQAIASVSWRSDFWVGILKCRGSCSVLHFRGRIFQSELLWYLTAQV